MRSHPASPLPATRLPKTTTTHNCAPDNERTYIVKNETWNTRPKKENTKQAILKAASELFVVKGFYATTTKAISKEAQIAEGTLFNYFETKEDLALYFFEEKLSGAMEWYRANRRLKNADITEKLFAIIQCLLERLEPYEEFIGAVMKLGQLLSMQSGVFPGETLRRSAGCLSNSWAGIRPVSSAIGRRRWAFSNRATHIRRSDGLSSAWRNGSSTAGVTIHLAREFRLKSFHFQINQDIAAQPQVVK